jgi:hypothetical protein
MATTAYSITQSGRYEPFDLQVAREQITWHETVFKFGLNLAVGTSFETIWSGSNLYTYLSSATVLKISSGSADDALGGTGARSVAIYGLDANYNEISESVLLNGQTAVNTGNSYLRITRMYVTTAGSGGTAAGIIYAGTGTVTTGVPAVVYAQIEIGYNQTAMALWTVPAGYTAYMSAYTILSATTTANTIFTGALFIRETGGVFRLQSSIKTVGGTGHDHTFDTALRIPEKTDIELRAACSTDGASATGEFQIIYIKNDAST